MSSINWRQLSRLAHHTIPQGLRERIADRVVFADAASARAYRHALEDLTGELVDLRLRALPHPFTVRASNDDLHVLREIVTYRDIMPPDGFDPTSILDVGANIGAAVALLAAEFPDAAVVGVEADHDNAKLCERNARPYGARVINVAAWTQDGSVSFGGRSESRLHVGEGDKLVPALSMNTLVEDVRPDFIVMDIEGGERELLARNTDWAQHVACIVIEVHPPYTLDECAADLRRLGFTASQRPAPRDPRVVGMRG